MRFAKFSRRYVAIAIVTSAQLLAWGDEPEREPAVQSQALIDSPPIVSGDASIAIDAGESKIVLTTTSRVSGAVDSLTWNGMEFVDSFDHGRQIQSASSFDNGRVGDYWAECFNPTEAGARRDGTGPHSTSRLQHLSSSSKELASTVQMAFWLAPGEQSSGRPATNLSELSDHQLTKRIRLGEYTSPHLIDFEVTFTVPSHESHSFAQFEALTGYMPENFSRFQKLNIRTGRLEPIDDGPGEQSWPIVLSTESGSHAMGVYSPDQPSLGWETAGYGRFRFQAEKVVKWNCVFRKRGQPVAPGDHSFKVIVAAGNLEQVRAGLMSIAKKSD